MVKHIDVRGTHFEIGEAHGRQAAAEIAVSLATYRRMFQEMAGLDWDTARYEAERFKAAIEHVCPSCWKRWPASPRAPTSIRWMCWS